MNCEICGKPANPEIGACSIECFDTDPESFRGLLLRAGYSIKNFSRETGASYKTAWAWYNGTRPPPPIALWAARKLAERRDDRVR